MTVLAIIPAQHCKTSPSREILLPWSDFDQLFFLIFSIQQTDEIILIAALIQYLSDFTTFGWTSLIE